MIVKAAQNCEVVKGAHTSNRTSTTLVPGSGGRCRGATVFLLTTTKPPLAQGDIVGSRDALIAPRHLLLSG